MRCAPRATTPREWSTSGAAGLPRLAGPVRARSTAEFQAREAWKLPVQFARCAVAPRLGARARGAARNGERNPVPAEGSNAPVQILACWKAPA
jgi:hypothetical protein